MTGVAIRPRPQEVVIRRGTYCSHEGKHTGGMREREPTDVAQRGHSRRALVALACGAGGSCARSGTWVRSREGCEAHRCAGHLAEVAGARRMCCAVPERERSRSTVFERSSLSSPMMPLRSGRPKGL